MTAIVAIQRKKPADPKTETSHEQTVAVSQIDTLAT